MSEKFDRQTVLDVIKGICIIFVVITHYGWDEKQRLVGLFPYIIDMAVPIFMIISGYVFSNSYLKKGIYHFEDAYDLSIISNRIIRYTIPFLIAYTIELIFFYLGNAIGVAVFILFYIKKKTLLHPHRKYLKMDKSIIKEIMWVCIPHTLEHFLLHQL